MGPVHCFGFRGDERAVNAGGRRLHIEVEVGEARLEELPCGGDGVNPFAGGVQDHEPPIGLLGVAVEVDGPLQGVSRGVGVSAVIFELGQAEVGVEGPAMEVLADRFDPGVVASLEEVAAVRVDGLAQCGSGLVVSGPGGICEGRLDRKSVV